MVASKCIKDLRTKQALGIIKEAVLRILKKICLFETLVDLGVLFQVQLKEFAHGCDGPKRICGT